MKNKKIISTVFATILMVVCFTAANTFAQTETDHSKMKDCCMMQDGKMMVMKDGKTMPMEEEMTMKNGTVCMTNGVCIMKDGKKMQMKDGECMDMSGNMDKCAMLKKDMKSSTDQKSDKKDMAMTYTCPMHPEVTSDQAGKCPKCGMDMIEKK